VSSDCYCIILIGILPPYNLVWFENTLLPLFTILFGFNSFWMFDIIERFKFEVFYALLDPANIP